MQAQFENMSQNKNTWFKSEFHARYIFIDLFESVTICWQLTRIL